jgi:hypothetical protein
VIGKVMAGLLGGILLSRTLAGFVAQQAGWRSMFWLGVPLAVAAGGLMRACCPCRGPMARRARAAVLSRAARLAVASVARSAVLRRSTLTQGLLFAAFSAFWSILALYVQQLGQGHGGGPVRRDRRGGDFGGALGGTCGRPARPGAAITAGTVLAMVGWACPAWRMGWSCWRWAAFCSIWRCRAR